MSQIRQMISLLEKNEKNCQNKNGKTITFSSFYLILVCRDISLKRPWFNHGTEKGIKIVDKNPLVDFFCCMSTLFWFHFGMKCQALVFCIFVFTFSFFFYFYFLLSREGRLLCFFSFGMMTSLTMCHNVSKHFLRMYRSTFDLNFRNTSSLFYLKNFTELKLCS